MSETFPSLGEIIEQMILPEFKSADTLPELIMAAIRSVNGLLFAAPFYIIAVLGIFSFQTGDSSMLGEYLEKYIEGCKIHGSGTDCGEDYRIVNRAHGCLR